MHYKDFLFEGKTVATIRAVVDSAVNCNTYVPVSTRRFSNDYDTTEIAEIILNGGYRFDTNKYISYYMTAESVAKIAGLGEFLNSAQTGDFKIGSKSYKVYSHPSKSFEYGNDWTYSSTRNKSYIIDVEGDTVDEVKPFKLVDSDAKDRIKHRVIVNSLKSDLSQTTIDAVFGDKEEVNFYHEIVDGMIKVVLLSSHDFLKDDFGFVIFGQQHTSKNERFMFVTKKINYGPISKHKFNTGSYSKSKIYKRADGMFVAK